ncbi:VOC family protein [Paenibacillus eucommiae]|uniref:Lactoylglutathione lyase n=1 Tax=Paenibacillus eucommiae TaxID=1355755 RepID=A0ABS4IP54_9BACL|nr:VOC family protein [Paenibacillus eucommiae]MBP1989340.1 lactoylglutathione lyase [Paenibacillus eucommiae]
MRIKESGFILFLENYEENVKFYTEKLGLPIRERKEGLSKLDFGGSYLMVEHQGISNETEKNRAQNPTVIRIEVEDFDQTIEELENRGLSIQVHRFNWGTIGVIIDPEGNRIEIKDY